MIEISGGYFECPSDHPPGGGGGIFSMLNATHDANGVWIARSSTPADGTFEMRLEKTKTPVASPVGGPNIFFGSYVTGTISGTARYSPDPAILGFPTVSRDESFVATGAIPVSGAIVDPKFGGGYVNAAASFVAGGATSTCPAGKSSWLLNGPF